jgi:hypothetical protein
LQIRKKLRKLVCCGEGNPASETKNAARMRNEPRAKTDSEKRKRMGLALTPYSIANSIWATFCQIAYKTPYKTLHF